MALIKCPECRKRFSDRAAACPNCGAPQVLAIQAAEDERVKRRKALLLIAGLVVVYLVVSGGKDETKTTSSTPAIDPAAQPTPLVEIPPAPTSSASSTPSKEPTVPASLWRYSSNKDEMRGVTNRWATLTSQNALSLDFPYNGGSVLRIIVRDMPKKHGRDVILEISKGQLDCGFDGCRVPVKFDDKPIVTYTASRADGGNSEIIFIREESGFLKRIKASKSVSIEVPIWRYGAGQYRFSSVGLEWK
ncbi:hydrogenase maturation nickel metallochaperone HypA [Bordetella sp. BOR01]|uniref:hydrogenase maturation nickel metallochaperone HypA n=1 Tax=Bordetella sp. BOR01 TaxID=2854779 RepID=UPI001C485428|nr:hydrogenase maturation nickel metallochaperone HypA [Bordetella sp. BOR01]MBV7482494.1 hydrogenase maturation nickel metallochaperone HypA [Bordetella sp. BOR01]